MILVDRLVGESLPFDGVRGGDDDPVPEWLIPAGWVEQVRAGKRERTLLPQAQHCAVEDNRCAVHCTVQW